MKELEFYFDVGSPYSYLGMYRMLQIAEKHPVEIIWKPMLLGGVLKAHGNSSPLEIPAKAKYSMMDIQRWAKIWDIPVTINPFLPINTLQMMRLITAVQMYQPESFLSVVKGIFNAMFREPQNLNDVNVLIQVAKSLDLELSVVEGWLGDEDVKAQLKMVTESAIQKGIFGAPTWIIDNEMIWGVDHLNFVEMALSD